MKRSIAVGVLLLATGCTTTIVEEPTQTTSEPATPTTSANTTTATSSSPPTTTSTTTTSTTTAAPAAQELFTTFAGPGDLAEAMPADRPADIVAVNAGSGEVVWEVPVPWSNWHWTQLVGDQIIHSSVRYEGMSAIAAIGLDGAVRWQATTPLQTNGPFLIDGGLLIGHGEVRDTEADTHVVFALDLADGSLVWSEELDWRPVYGEEGSVVGGGGVGFAAGMAGDVIAIDTATGSPLWELQLESEVIGAPHVTGDLLLVDAFATLVALDPSTGDIVWRTEPDGRLIASPEGISGGNAIAWHGNLETGFEISGIDPSNGSVKWTDSCYRQFEVYDEFAVGFAPDPEFDWPQTVKIWDGSTGAVLAEQVLNANIDPFSISASESTAYVGTDDGQLAAINIDGAARSWTAQLRGAITLTTIANGVVFASASDREVEMRGAVHALDASTGEMLWSTDLAFEARTQPLMAEGIVIVISAEEVWGTF